MFTKTIGSSAIAFMVCALGFLSAMDAEAGCHRHRRSACCNPCCDPCCGTIVEVAPYVTSSCCGTVVVEEVVVSSCCMASNSSTPATASTPAPTVAVNGGSRSTTAIPVSVIRQRK